MIPNPIDQIMDMIQDYAAQEIVIETHRRSIIEFYKSMGHLLRDFDAEEEELVRIRNEKLSDIRQAIIDLTWRVK